MPVKSQFHLFTKLFFSMQIENITFNRFIAQSVQVTALVKIVFQYELIIFYHFRELNNSSPLTYITLHIDLFA